MTAKAAPLTPAEALSQIAFLLERELAPTHKVQAFRRALATVKSTSTEELREVDQANKLTKLSAIGPSSAQVISESLAGKHPQYLAKLEQRREPDPEAGHSLRQSLKGDCHSHSLWSDGGASIEDMARTAKALGHQYLVVTDHSPRLKVANGLSPERLVSQWQEIDEVNDRLAQEGGNDFRLLKGIEVDINEDGTLDQQDELLDALDIVVGSVHSKLRSEPAAMTERLLKAIENPHLDILGHCTGRKVVEPMRPPSDFDSEAVFQACRKNNVAVEINSRRERRDPPRELLRQAVQIGCSFSINTDAHAQGQLDWQFIGTERAEQCGVSPDSVINTLPVHKLLPR